MRIDDWNAGTLPETDPWAVEALKRGLIRPRTQNQVLSISPNPPEPGKNLLNPHLPGTKAFTKRVDAMELPNPLTTKPSENYMYDVGAVAPIKGVGGMTELWHGIQYPKTYKGFRLEGDPQGWGAVQYSQIDKGANAAPITFYVKPGQKLDSRIEEVMRKFK